MESRAAVLLIGSIVTSVITSVRLAPSFNLSRASMPINSTVTRLLSGAGQTSCSVTMTCAICPSVLTVSCRLRPSQRSRSASKVPGPIEASTTLRLTHISTITASMPVNTYNPIGLRRPDRLIVEACRRGEGCVSGDSVREIFG